MFKSYLRLCFYLIAALTSFHLQASISPVVIDTYFKIGAWQPLPEDKIKSASVESALSEISKTKRFAFFTSPQTGLKTGKLRININLIEAAETATVSILLQQANGVSISSTHSESLKNLTYDGIYKRFQKAGAMAGKKLVITYNSRTPLATNQKVSKGDQARVKYLENQIININNNIIKKSDKNPVRSEAKLEFILSELQSIKNEYDKLAKKEDIHKQGVKIDKVLDEVGELNKKIDNKPSTQINVKQNYVIENALIGKTKISEKSRPGRDDAKAKHLYDEAMELKPYKKYNEAEKKLQLAMKMSISSGLSSLILDELNYSLPMFEAQSIAIDLGSNFQAYSKNGLHKKKLDRITYLYKTALKNNQHDFQRTRQIQQMLDQHLNTGQAMSAALSVQSKSNAYMVHRYMQQTQMMQGTYPDKKEFVKLLSDYRLRYEVISYNTDGNKYTAKLRSSSGSVFDLKVNDHGEMTVN